MLQPQPNLLASEECIRAAVFFFWTSVFDDLQRREQVSQKKEAATVPDYHSVGLWTQAGNRDKSHWAARLMIPKKCRWEASKDP